MFREIISKISHPYSPDEIQKMIDNIKLNEIENIAFDKFVKQLIETKKKSKKETKEKSKEKYPL